MLLQRMARASTPQPRPNDAMTPRLQHPCRRPAHLLYITKFLLIENLPSCRHWLRFSVYFFSPATPSGGEIFHRRAFAVLSILTRSGNLFAIRPKYTPQALFQLNKVRAACACGES